MRHQSPEKEGETEEHIFAKEQKGGLKALSGRYFTCCPEVGL
jgi:hypothetical protein